MAKMTIERTEELLMGGFATDARARQFLENMVARNKLYVQRYERELWLKGLTVGDPVVRMLAGKIPCALKVTKVTDNLLFCGPWTFSRETGAEIDPDMGEFDGLHKDEQGYIMAVSYIVSYIKPTENGKG